MAKLPDSVIVNDNIFALRIYIALIKPVLQELNIDICL